MRIRRLLSIFLIPAMLAGFTTGCMSKYEYMLRQQDMKAKAVHPAFGEIVIEGPLQVEKGGKLVIPYPNQPYSHTPIPDGQAIQANVINSTLKTAAVVTGFIYGVHSAKGKESVTINNNAPAAGGQ